MADRFTGPRVEYGLDVLDESALLPDPCEQLRAWVDEATNAGVVEPTAMCLSTVSPEGRPSGRIVLMRVLDARGLVFFTNYESSKGRDLASNPRASACFWWPDLQRQVRVEGIVERVTDEESDAYFASRPLESRFASVVSPQSRPIASRDELDAAIERLREEFPNGPPRPPTWGGYRLRPERFEFWQGRTARLHDRFEFRLVQGVWSVRRLAP